MKGPSPLEEQILVTEFYLSERSVGRTILISLIENSKNHWKRKKSQKASRKVKTRETEILKNMRPSRTKDSRKISNFAEVLWRIGQLLVPGMYLLFNFSSLTNLFNLIWVYKGWRTKFIYDHKKWIVWESFTWNQPMYFMQNLTLPISSKRISNQTKFLYWSWDSSDFSWRPWFKFWPVV